MNGGCRNGSRVKSTCCSHRGTRFGLQHPQGSWQLSTAPVPGHLKTSSSLHSNRMHTHTINTPLIIFKCKKVWLWKLTVSRNKKPPVQSLGRALPYCASITPGQPACALCPRPPTPHPPSRFGMTSLRAKTRTPLLMVIPVAFTRIDPATSGKSYLPVTKEPGGCSWVQ